MDGDTVGCVRQVESSYVGVLGCLPSGESSPVTWEGALSKIESGCPWKN